MTENQAHQAAENRKQLDLSAFPDEVLELVLEILVKRRGSRRAKQRAG